MNARLSQNTAAPIRRIPLWRQIRWNLIVVSVLLTVVPLLIATYLSLSGRYADTVSQISSQLESVAALKANQINFWLQQANESLDRTLAGVNRLSAELTQASGELFPDAQARLSAIYKQLTRTGNLYSETFFYNMNGEVLAASNDARIGQRVTAQPYFKASLSGPHLQSPYYELGTNALTMMATRPVLDASQTQVGVLAARLNLDVLNQIMRERTGLGESGETYLVSQESHYLLNPSRFEAQGYIQTRAYHSAGIDAVLENQSDFHGVYADYRGVEVIGSGLYVPALQAGLIAEIDADQALAEYYQSAATSGVATFIAAFIAAAVAFAFASRFTRPILNLAQTALRIGSGDLKVRASVNVQNEVGLLAQTFNQMTDQVSELVGSLETRVADRTRDLATTIEVGRLATSIYNRDELLPRLVEFIRARFGLYYTQIYLLDDAQRYALLKAGTGEVGQQLLARGHRLDLEQTSLVARAVQSGEPVLVADTAQSSIHKANDLLPLTRSEVTIPLIIGGQTLGVLDMQAERPNTFNTDNISVFEAMAGQIAAALRGLQTLDEVRAATHQAQTVNRRLTEEAWESYLGALTEGQPLGYQYDLEAPRPLSNGLERHDGRRIVQPILLRGQQIGQIVVEETDDERQMRPEEQALMADVAGRLAQALDQFRAFDQIKQAQVQISKRAAELQTVADVSAATTTILDVDELLQNVSDLTKERFHLYHAHIYLLDDAGENLVLAAGAGEPGRIMKREGRSIPLHHPHSLVALAAREHHGVVVNDVSQNPDFLPNPLLPDTKSEMAVPMLIGDQLIGVLDVQASITDRFTDEDVRVKTTLASQIAVAVQNARAFAAAERRARELAVVSDVSAHVTTILDPETLVHSVADLTASSFGLYHLHIYLTDAAGQYLELVAGAGEAACRQVGAGYRVEINDEHHLAARAAKQRQSIINNRITHDVDFELNPNLPETRSQLVVPMTAGDQVVGVIEVFADRVGGFTEQDVLIQSTLAAQIAVAIQNARAYMQTKQQAAVIETSRDFISIADFDSRIIYVNPGGLAMVGRESFVDTFIADYYPEEEYRRIQQEAVPTALETGHWRGEVTLRRADGSTLPADQTILVVRDNDGTPINLATIITDITERKQQQAALERERALLRNLIDSIPDLIFYKDVDGVYLGCNKAFAAFSGLPESQIMGKTDFDMFPPDVAAFFREQDQIMMQQRQSRSNEEWVTYPDGTEVLLDTLKTTFTTSSGELLGLIGISRDITERKMQEIALAQQRRLLDAVLANIPSGILVVEAPSATPILSNRRAEELLGRGIRPEANKEHLAEVYEAYVYGTDELYPAERQPIVRGLYGETSMIDDMEVRRPDGTRVLLEIAGAPIRDEAGNIVASVVAFQDITERRAREEALRLSQERFALAVEGSNDGLWDWDIASNLVYFSPRWKAMLGYEDHELENSFAVWEQLVHPDDIDAVKDLLNRYLGRQVPVYQPEFRMQHKDGSYRWILARAAAVWNDAGQPLRLTGSHTDITERKLAEREIAKRAAELQTVAEVSAATTTILEVDKLLQAVTDLTKERFGLYHAHIYLMDEEGQNLRLAAGAGDAGRLMKAEGRSIPLNHPNSLVARAARTRKGVIANDVAFEPEFLPNPLLPNTQSEMAVPMIVGGRVIGVLDVQADVVNRFTDEDVRIKTMLADQVAIAVENAQAYRIQQEAADRLREVDRLKSQFLANMSHELRTPLNSIIGYAEVLLDGIDGDLTDEASEDVQAIHGAGKHLLSIINDILDLAKIDAGQMYMDRQETDLLKIVEEVIHTCQILVKDKGISIGMECEGDIPTVYGDPVRLRQIVYNLVNNAIKFTEQGGITISLGYDHHRENQLYIEVADTGIGMSQKDLSVIFERFRQVDGSATRRAGGTGLGLAITRQLVQMHDGDISVTSEPGQGSTFRFTLPVFVGQTAAKV